MKFSAGALVALSLVAGVCLAEADLGSLVVVGDSLSAGFRSGGLVEGSQEQCYGALVAGQAGTPLALPLIGEPGIPNVLELLAWGPPPLIAPAAGSSPGRLDPFLVATNLAVPGHDTLDALSLRPEMPIDDLTDLILGLPGLFQGISMSQVEWAEALQPTTILLWIGSNDTLGAATTGSPERMTDPEVFEQAYGELFDRLADTGASIVVLNIPDTTVVPFLTSAEEFSWAVGVPLPLLELALGTGPGDFITLPGLDRAQAILGGLVPGPLPDELVLDAEEVVEIRERTALFNGFIAGKAAARGAALVDINALLTGIDAEGLDVCGQRLTTRNLGGVFSLDGIHPTATGQAFVANAVIDALNRGFGNHLQQLDLCAVAARDPLVNPRTSDVLPGASGGGGLLAPRPN